MLARINILILVHLLTAASLFGGWTQMAEMNEARAQFGIATHAARIYVFGGLGEENRHQAIASAECYNPENDEWTEIEPLPMALAGPAAVSHGQYIYILGGKSERGEPQDAVYQYNPRTDRYLGVAKLPVPAYDQMAVALGRNVILFGGRVSENEFANRCQFFLPGGRDTARWETDIEINQPRAGFGAAYTRGVLYVFGGIFHGGPLARVDRFYGSIWEPFSRMPEPLTGLAAAMRGDSIMIAGGRRQHQMGVEVTNDISFFNPRGQTWWSAEYDTMSQPRADFGLVNLQGEIYAIGGWTDPRWRADITSSVERYYPGLAAPPDYESDGNRDAFVSVRYDIGNLLFSLPANAVSVQLFDLTGRSLGGAQLPAGTQFWNFDAQRLPHGAYLYRVEMLGNPAGLTGRVVILR